MLGWLLKDLGLGSSACPSHLQLPTRKDANLMLDECPICQLSLDVSASNVKSPKSVYRVPGGKPFVSLKIDTLLDLPVC